MNARQPQPGIYRLNNRHTGYSRISNEFARDGALPARARSVGLYVLSHAAGFVLTHRVIAKHLNMSEGTVRAALDDLAAAGYLVSWTVRDAKGRVEGTYYVINDERMTLEQWQEAVPGLTSKSDVRCLTSKSLTSKTETRVFEVHKGDEVPSSATKEPKCVSDGSAAPPAPGELDLDLPAPTPSLTVDAVVAAYIEGYTSRHRGRRPIGAILGMIGKEAKRLLADDAVTDEELVEAARETGEIGQRSIATQINIIRDRGPQGRPAIGRRSRSGVLGPAPVPPRSERPTPKLLPPPEQWSQSEREAYAWQAAEDGIPEDVWVTLSNRLRLAATPEEEQAVRDEWDRTEAAYRNGKVATG
jgi:hypothetical protein